LALLLTAGTAAAESGPSQVGFGQPMRVDQGERVETIVSVGGNLTVLGEVEDDAVVIGGTLELGPEARIGGDAVAVGGTIIAPSGAVVVGDRVEVRGTYGQSVGQRNGVGVSGALASSFATFIQ